MWANSQQYASLQSYKENFEDPHRRWAMGEKAWGHYAKHSADINSYIVMLRVFVSWHRQLRDEKRARAAATAGRMLAEQITLVMESVKALPSTTSVIGSAA